MDTTEEGEYTYCRRILEYTLPKLTESMPRTVTPVLDHVRALLARARSADDLMKISDTAYRVMLNHADLLGDVSFNVMADRIKRMHMLSVPLIEEWYQLGVTGVAEAHVGAALEEHNTEDQRALVAAITAHTTTLGTRRQATLKASLCTLAAATEPQRRTRLLALAPTYALVELDTLLAQGADTHELSTMEISVLATLLADGVNVEDALTGATLI